MASGDAKAPETLPTPEPCLFAEFLANVPPSQARRVKNLATPSASSDGRAFRLEPPELELHCPTPRCNGRRTFRPVMRPNGVGLTADEPDSFFLLYRCSNCQDSLKMYSLRTMIRAASTKGERGLFGPIEGECYKYGEEPSFGPVVPTRLNSLLGPDRSIFFAGRRCESQGLGIGAFAYYRRVVENQKSRIIDEIIKVCRRQNAPAALLAELEAARGETQFSEAVGMIKSALPPSLLIDGQHNPLTLLHSALSVGLHELPDEECLSRAQEIRVVLADLAERLDQALKDRAELAAAIKRMLGRKAPIGC